MLHERRRARQRHLEVDRSRRHLDAADKRHPARLARTDRARRLQAERQHSLRVDRSRGWRWRPWRRRREGPAAAPAGGGWRSGSGRWCGGCRRSRRPARHAAAIRRQQVVVEGSWRRRWWWRHDRSLSIRRRRRELAAREHRQPASDVLQPGADRSQQPGRRDIWRGRPADVDRRRKDGEHAGRVGHPFGPSRDLDQSEGLEPRPDRKRRRPGRVVRPEQDVDLPAQSARRALLPRGLRHGDAVQRVRRHAGQLQLVRTERDAVRARHRQLRLVPGAGRRRIRDADGSARRADRLHRVAEREHDAEEHGHGRVEEHPADQRKRRARYAGAVPVQLGHADHLLAARAWHADRRGAPRVPVDRSRRFVGGHQRGSDDERRSRRDRHDGPARQPDPDRAERRHHGLADDRLARRVAEAAGTLFHRAPTTAP